MDNPKWQGEFIAKTIRQIRGGQINLFEEKQMSEERMIKWFAWNHLPEHLQVVSKEFHRLAETIIGGLEPGPERTVALRKLLEAKDAAVRAKLHPGG